MTHFFYAMNSSEKKIKLEKIVEDALAPHGCELVLCELKKSGPDWVLRVFLDHPMGVTLDLCSAVSHSLSEVLDEQDLIEHAYELEVSSPGVDRPLVKPRDFERFLNNRVYVKTHMAIEGTKVFTGDLCAFSEDRISVANEADERVYDIPLQSIAKATLKPILDFS